jgi:hypothetical protein
MVLILMRWTLAAPAITGPLAIEELCDLIDIHDRPSCFLKLKVVRPAVFIAEAKAGPTAPEPWLLASMCRGKVDQPRLA